MLSVFFFFTFVFMKKKKKNDFPLRSAKTLCSLTLTIKVPTVPIIIIYAKRRESRKLRLHPCRLFSMLLLLLLLSSVIWSLLERR